MLQRLQIIKLVTKAMLKAKPPRTRSAESMLGHELEVESKSQAFQSTL